MKKLFALVVFSVFVFSLTACGGEKYNLNLPDEKDVTLISTDTFANDVHITVTLETEENIGAFMRLLKADGRTTKRESVRDTPKATNYIKIDIISDTDTETVFLYKYKKNFYIEQPYNGVYKIPEDEFARIVGFYESIKEDVYQTERYTVQQTINSLKPVDIHGESFRPVDLTNRELLRYGFFIFNPKERGIKEITFAELNEKYIAEYFGITTAVPGDITCPCDEIIAKYNSETDIYTWDDTFHYYEHIADSFFAWGEVSKVDNKYIVEINKLFTALNSDAKPEEYTFYHTYNDAKDKKNMLFHVSNTTMEPLGYASNLFTSHTSDELVTYILTFTAEDKPKLLNYEIVGFIKEYDNGIHTANPYQALYRRLREWMYT